MKMVLRVLMASSLLAAAFAVAPQLAQQTNAACGVSIYRIYYDSPGSDDGSNYSLNHEWIQLKNSCSTGKSLYHWTIKDAVGHTYTFGSYTLAGSSKIKVHTGSGSNTSTDRYWGSKAYIWNNSGSETAKVRNSAGSLIDSCSYTGNSTGYVYC
jgi:hypothetical protein